MERAAGVEPAIPPWEGGALPLRNARMNARSRLCSGVSLPVTRHRNLTWSLSPVPTRADNPYQGLTDADPKGKCWPGWTRTSVANSASKADGPCQQSNRPPEPPPGPEPGTFRLQGGCAADCAKEASHRECSAVRTAWQLELPGPDPGRRATAGSPPSCARPDLNRDAPRGAQRPQRCASAFPPRAHGASGRCRTACLRLTRATLCQVSYRGMASGAGLEPAGARVRALLGRRRPTRKRVREARFERAGCEV